MCAKKIDLAKEASRANDIEEVEPKITEDLLLELVPKSVLKALKAAKTPAARADLLFDLDRGALKEVRDAYTEMDTFVKKLKQWFIQEFTGDQQGVTGKRGRVELKPKEVAVVEDWDKFYGHIAKKKEFDLLNKAINQKSISERWDSGKQVPGIGSINRYTVSLTSAKK